MGSFASVFEYMRAFMPLVGDGESVVAQPWARSTETGMARLAAHLQEHYGIDAKPLKELDQCVFVAAPKKRGEPKWIVRVDGVGRPMAQAEGDAEFLRFLEAHDYPAERLHPKGVTTFDDRAVMVTGFVPGKGVFPTPAAAHAMGELTGRLHALPAGPPATTRPAGSWHRLSLAGGTRVADRDNLVPMLQFARDNATGDERRGAYDALIAELEEVVQDHPALPQCLIHIDLGGPNLLSSPDGFVGIDWAGAGTGTRIAGLASLKDAAKKPEMAKAFMDGYRQHVKLDDAEFAQLGAAIRTHGLVLEAWVCLFVPDRVEATVKGCKKARKDAERSADLVASLA